MRMTTSTMALVSYMVLAILLAGSISAWPWLGLLTVVVCRCCEFPRLPVPILAHPAHQAPHFLRRRAARRAAAADAN